MEVMLCDGGNVNCRLSLRERTLRPEYVQQWMPFVPERSFAERKTTN